MRFYLGTHQPAWLARDLNLPLLVSHRRLADRRSLPRATGRWACDSGGFSELSLHGHWRTSARAYVTAIRRYANEIGQLDWAAPMDHQTEPDILARTGATVHVHQHRTVANYLHLRDLAPDLPIIPVLQGQSVRDYQHCADIYERHGVDLAALPLVGVGSVCRRQHTAEVERIMRTLSQRGLRLHGFGVKISGLGRYAETMSSADSASWSRQGRFVPGCSSSHRSESNCLRFALAWHDRLMRSLANTPTGAPRSKQPTWWHDHRRPPSAPSQKQSPDPGGCSMPEWYYQDDTVTLYAGDATDTLAGLPDESLHCVVTSPPYWGLRDYGTGRWVGGDPDCRHLAAAERGDLRRTEHPTATHPGAGHRAGGGARCRRCGAHREDDQHGLEPTPDLYVDRLRGVFVELRRVLVDTGTVWLNLGDSYSADPPGSTANPMRASTLTGAAAAEPLRESMRSAGVRRTGSLPRKNVIGMPWRVAFALQSDGWILRNAIIWHKPNAMPESVRDRLSTRYETIFLLTKQQRYFFDLDAIREPLVRPEALAEGSVLGGSNKGRHAGVGATARRRGQTVYGTNSGKYATTEPFMRAPGEAVCPTGTRHGAGDPRGKNPGDVWSMPTRPLREAHYAAFPIDLPLRCIAAGCPAGGVVLDPFSGAATTGLAARQLGRRYVGIDLNSDFHDIGLRRLGLSDTAARRAA